MWALFCSLLIPMAGMGFAAALLRGGPAVWDLADGECRPLLWRFGLLGAVGYAIIGLLGIALAAVGWLVSWLFWTLTICGIACFALGIRKWFCDGEKSPPFTPFEKVLAFASAVAVLLLVWVTLNPRLEIDDITYHLSVPRAYWNEGRLFAIPFEGHSNWHQLSSMAHLWGFALRPETVLTAKMQELWRCLFGACAAAGVAGWLGGRRCSLVTLLLSVTYWEFSRYGTIAHTDAGQTMYVVCGGALLAAEARQSTYSVRRIAIAGFLAGCPYAVKQSGLLLSACAGAAWCIVLFMRFIKERNIRTVIRDGAVMIVAAALPVLPWWIKNGVFTGSPFLPLLTATFPLNADAQIAFTHIFQYYEPGAAFGTGRTLPGLSHFHTVISNARLNHVNAYLLWAPLAAGLAIWNRRRAAMPTFDKARMFLFLFLFLTMPFFLLLPFWRFFAAVGPLALALVTVEVEILLRPLFKERLVIAWHSLLASAFVYGFVQFHMAGNGAVAQLPLAEYRPSLNAAGEMEFYYRLAPEWDLLEEINQTLGPNDRLLVSATSQGLPMLKCRFIPNAPCICHEAIATMEELGFTADQMYLYLLSHGVTHILTREHLDQGTAAEFRDRYLEELLVHLESGTVLWRMRDSFALPPGS